LESGGRQLTFLKYFGVLAAALIVQSTIVHWSFLGNIHPDLVLVILVFLSLKKGPIVGVFSGFLIGLIQDVYAIETLGANAFCKSIVGYFVGLFDETRFTFTPTTKLVFLLSAFFVHDVVYNISIGLSSKAILMAFLKNSIPAGVFTLIIGTVVFYYFNPKPRT
jgi:rod shape-determining protein MreD